MFISDKWQDYRIIDAGDGEKLERWGPVIVVRPDPQIIWPRMKPESVWQKRHMHYYRSKSGGGRWEQKLPSAVKTNRLAATSSDIGELSKCRWTIAYKDLTFNIRPTDFKHMGLFPEQAANWDWVMDLIKKAKRQVRVLNLFGYTGAATVCCLCAGADVTHVDAAKGMNVWAKDNIKASSIKGQTCRIMTDDVYKFVRRELRRGSFYDGIMLDPPSYGRGPSGEIWKIENRLYDLLNCCADILSDRPLFMLLNTYTTGFTATAAENVLRLALKKRQLTGKITGGSLGLPIGDSELILPCGISVRCTFTYS